MTIEDIITFLSDEMQGQTLTHQDMTRCVLLAFDLGVSTTHAVPRPEPFSYTNDWLAGMGYTTYSMVTERKNYQGLPMPTWDELPDPQKQAWLAATAAIRRRVVNWRLSAEEEDPDDA